MIRASAATALAALAALDVTAELQIAAAVVMLAAALAIGRARQKDATIKDLDAALDAREERLKEIREQLAGAQTRADQEHEQRRDAEKMVAQLHGQLEEMHRYTAEGALGELKDIITKVVEDGAMRYAANAERQEHHERLIVGAMQAQGELILKNTELAAKAIAQLERVAGDLEDLTAALRVWNDRDRPPS